MKCDVDIKGTIMGAHGSPMFHGLGSFLYSGAVRLSIADNHANLHNKY